MSAQAKAWLDPCSSDLWLAFEDPKGVAPITLVPVVRTLDRGASSTPEHRAMREPRRA